MVGTSVKDVTMQPISDSTDLILFLYFPSNLSDLFLPGGQAAVTQTQTDAHPESIDKLQTALERWI